MGKNKTNKAVRVYRVQTRIETGNENLQLFVAADERAIEFLRQEMQQHPVTFVYRKEGGEIVRRTGTLQAEVLADNYLFKLSNNNLYRNPRYLRYWDLDRRGWRTCYCENLIGYFEV